MWLYFVLSLLSGIIVYWLCVVDRHRHSKHTGYAEYIIQALGQHRQDIIAKIRETKVARHEAALAEDYRTAVQYKHVLETSIHDMNLKTPPHKQVLKSGDIRCQHFESQYLSAAIFSLQM